jgi:hypothetical protein
MLRDAQTAAIDGSDLLYASARSQAELIRKGKISARELIEITIRRAEDTAHLLNCIAIPLYDQALEQASGIDAALARGENPGPFCGVPITIKVGSRQRVIRNPSVPPPRKGSSPQRMTLFGSVIAR